MSPHPRPHPKSVRPSRRSSNRPHGRLSPSQPRRLPRRPPRRCLSRRVAQRMPSIGRKSRPLSIRTATALPLLLLLPRSMLLTRARPPRRWQHLRLRRCPSSDRPLIGIRGHRLPLPRRSSHRLLAYRRPLFSADRLSPCPARSLSICSISPAPLHPSDRRPLRRPLSRRLARTLTLAISKRLTTRKPNRKSGRKTRCGTTL
jgi:hypothetical protein